MMYNFLAKYRKILEICKQYSKKLVHEFGDRNIFRPKNISISLTAGAIGIQYDIVYFCDIIQSQYSCCHLFTRKSISVIFDMTNWFT